MSSTTWWSFIAEPGCTRPALGRHHRYSDRAASWSETADGRGRGADATDFDVTLPAGARAPTGACADIIGIGVIAQERAERGVYRASYDPHFELDNLEELAETAEDIVKAQINAALTAVDGRATLGELSQEPEHYWLVS